MTFEEALQIVCDVQCDPFRLHLHRFGTGDHWYLQASMERTCVTTGKTGVGRGGKYYVSSFSTEAELVQKCLAACLAYAEHEVREHFHYRGKRPFNPHISLEALMSVCENLVRREEPGAYK